MNIHIYLSHLIQGLLNKKTLEVGKSNIRISNKNVFPKALYLFNENSV